VSFELHTQLKNDCYIMGRTPNCVLLLHKNALVPWFILVPETDKNEIFKLETHLQLNIQAETSQLALLVDKIFSPDKINIASIGNVVPQLHIHVIGRFKNDFCWPAPVWCQTDFSAYNNKNLQSIIQSVEKMGHMIELTLTTDQDNEE